MEEERYNDDDDDSSCSGPNYSGNVDDAHISQPATNSSSKASTPTLVPSGGDHGGEATMARRVRS
jgi:hypothetical protein